MNGLTDFTFSMWVKLDAWSTEMPCFFQVVNNAMVASDDFALCGRYISIKKSTNAVFKTFSNIAVGPWVHMGVVRDVGNDFVKLYVDGVEIGNYNGFFGGGGLIA